MKKTYAKNFRDARKKKSQPLPVGSALAIQEFIAGMRADIEAFSAQLGLQVMGAIMEQEIEQRIGPWASKFIIAMEAKKVMSFSRAAS